MYARKTAIITLQLIGICLFYQFISWGINKIGLPIPANVFGMVLLFLLLVTGIIPMKWVEEGANVLLQYMPLMFVPFGVAMVTYKDLFFNYGLTIIVVLFTTSFFASIFTGLSTQAWQKLHQPKQNQQEENNHANVS